MSSESKLDDDGLETSETAEIGPQSKPYVDDQDRCGALLLQEAKLASKLAKTEGQVDQETLQKWWSLVGAICGELAQPPGVNPQAQMLLRLKGMAQELAYGRVPLFVKDAAREGNLSAWQERRDRAIGAAYKRAVAAGLIEDSKSSQTVADAFGLMGTRIPPKWAADESLQEDFPEVFEYPPEVLKMQMKAAGARYRLYGPTHEAIRARGQT